MGGLYEFACVSFTRLALHDSRGPGRRRIPSRLHGCLYHRQVCRLGRCQWGSPVGCRLARMAEELLYGLDLIGLALFVIKEFIKLGKHMLFNDWNY